VITTVLKYKIHDKLLSIIHQLQSETSVAETASTFLSLEGPLTMNPRLLLSSNAYVKVTVHFIQLVIHMDICLIRLGQVDNNALRTHFTTLTEATKYM
jgi:hypothetical protein